MANTMKRSTQANPLPQFKDLAKAPKPRPHPIDTSVANQYCSWQTVARKTAVNDSIPTASNTYSQSESDTGNPFADQAVYEELPLPNVKMRSPAPSTPYPPQTHSTPFHPDAAILQPQTPYSVATLYSPLTRSLDQTLSTRRNSSPSPFTTRLSLVIGMNYAQSPPSTRLTALISILPHLDTSVADYGPYNRDWDFKEFPLIAGRWEHFYRPSQLWLANELLGWWEGWPSPGSDGIYQFDDERGVGDEDDGDGNGWKGLPSPISPLGALGDWIW